METSYQKILGQIIDLKVKDTIPSHSSVEVRDGHKNRITVEVSHDYSELSIEAFNKKYEKYLNAIQKKANGTYKKPKAPKKGDKSIEEIEKEQEEYKTQALKKMQEKFPPNKRFFSWTNKDEDKWNRYEELPTVESVASKNAMRWTNGMIGAASSKLGSFVLVAIHHESRVIEFEYVYTDGKLYSPTF